MAHELYNQLQYAYDYLNKELFASRLPACIITVQRENESVHGYFSAERFASKNGVFIDEIAMNPIYFVNARFENVLATLGHEMVHQEQHHFGERGRGRYHNKQWGDWMERIGLMPSSTGKKGGKKTGDCMGDFIIKDGKFDQVCKLLISNDFEITWYDQRIFYSPVFVQQTALEPINYGDHISIIELVSGDSTVNEISSSSGENAAQPPALTDTEGIKRLKDKVRSDMLGVSTNGSSGTEGVPSPVKPVDAKKKTTYLCPHCRVKVWGRPNLELHCNTCHLDFVES